MDAHRALNIIVFMAWDSVKDAGVWKDTDKKILSGKEKVMYENENYQSGSGSGDANGTTGSSEGTGNYYGSSQGQYSGQGTYNADNQYSGQGTYNADSQYGNGQGSYNANGQNNQQGQNYYQDYTGNAAYQGGNYTMTNGPEKQSPNALSIVGLVLGILSIFVGCCGFYGLVLSIPGLICSIIGRRQTKSGVAMAGIICSVVGIVIAILITVLAVIGILMMSAADGAFDYYYYLY